MRRGLESQTGKTGRSQDPERGFILISLMLMFALMAIALLAILPSMVQQIKRDREQEMCRRGTQYMRAIQRFQRKLGRYPSKIEDLESTNNMRFLRKRYKDPLMKDAQGHDKDFKLLHMQDIMLNNGPMLGGTGSPGGLASLLQNGSGTNQPGLQNLLTAQSPGGLQGALAQASQLGGLQAGQSTTTNLNGNSDSQSSDSSGNGGSGSSGSPGPNSGPGGSISASGSGLSGQTFGGGPILGVASTSKEKTIREYNKKNHYNDWYFIYDQSMDRGGLLVGPWQPALMIGNSNLGQPIPGQPGQGIGQGLSQPGSGFGQSQNGFGQPQSGFGQGMQNAPAQNQNANPPQN